MSVIQYFLFWADFVLDIDLLRGCSLLLLSKRIYLISFQNNPLFLPLTNSATINDLISESFSPAVIVTTLRK